MKLTRDQTRDITFHMEVLTERLRQLRRTGDLSVPAEDNVAEFFTEPGDYTADEDPEIDYVLSVIRGMSIGLGLDGPEQLYQMYVEGLEEHQVPDVSLLVVASERALMTLKDGESELVREIVNELGSALAPFAGREWR